MRPFFFLRNAKDKMRTRPTIKACLALTLLGLLALASYWPGLQGGFLFDDFGNLPVLGSQGPIDHWAIFWRYITSGKADPTGRPLTLLTFLLDARDWPAAPYPFKRTNLILHLLNGALLHALLTRLGERLARPVRQVRIAAMFGCACWVLHPLLVSTTLYVVQREAMLPATCVMAGLLFWLHGRQQLAAGKIISGLGWSSLGLGGFTLLGMLAKANGALLPLYALLIEIIVLASQWPIIQPKAKRAYRAAMLVLAVVPAIIILGGLAWTGIRGIMAATPVGIRPWTVGQRLLTEPRVLMDYLQLLWLPRPFSSGLFNDQYAASTSWLQPVTTLPALLAVLILISAAWRQRQRHPAAALALLFYFAGHLLESTSIPLELYFEHRNYVPALLMFWPLGLWLGETRNLRMAKLTLTIALPLALACMTHARASLWGDTSTQALMWARINPDSPRAQANAADIEMESGHLQDASRRLQRLLSAQPDQAQIAFNLIDAHCMAGSTHPGDVEAAIQSMERTRNTGSLFARWFEHALPLAASKHCSGLTLEDLLKLLDAGVRNPNLASPGPQQDLIYMRGRIALAEHQPAQALTDFISALDLQVRPGMALQTAAMLGSHGYPADGLIVLDHYRKVQKNTMQPDFGMPMLHDWILERQNYWPTEFSHLHQQLLLDADVDSANTVNSVHASDTAH